MPSSFFALPTATGNLVDTLAETELKLKRAKKVLKAARALLRVPRVYWGYSDYENSTEDFPKRIRALERELDNFDAVSRKRKK